MLEDPKAAAVDEIAAKLGLCKVGFLFFSRLTPSLIGCRQAGLFILCFHTVLAGVIKQIYDFYGPVSQPLTRNWFIIQKMLEHVQPEDLKGIKQFFMGL